MREYLRSYFRRNSWDFTLFVLIMLETGLLLYFKKEVLSNEINAFCFTGCGIAIAIVFFLKYYRRRIEVRAFSPLSASPFWLQALPVLLLLAGVLSLVPGLVAVFRDMPIDARFSDVIPTIQVAVQRWLGGERVYAEIDKWGYKLPLTYLPFQWMPYALAEIGNFDYRWIAIGIYTIAGGCLVWITGKHSVGKSYAVAFLCFFLLWTTLKNNSGIFTMTVEFMVAGYYMLFVAGLAGKNPWLKGLFIAICLLSRYSLVLWLPLWAFVEWFSGNRNAFFKSAVSIAFVVLLVYIVPFLSEDWGLFMRGYKYYSVAALGEWKHNLGGELPFHLDQGVGFARYYFQMENLPLEDRIRSLQKTHVIVCLGSTLLFMVMYWFIRSKVHPRIYLLTTFKIYLCLFLAFIQVPYAYLMVTAMAVSIAMLAAGSRWQLKKAEE